MRDHRQHEHTMRSVVFVAMMGVPLFPYLSGSRRGRGLKSQKVSRDYDNHQEGLISDSTALNRTFPVLDAHFPSVVMASEARHTRGLKSRNQA